MSQRKERRMAPPTSTAPLQRSPVRSLCCRGRLAGPLWGSRWSSTWAGPSRRRGRGADSSVASGSISSPAAFSHPLPPKLAEPGPGRRGTSPSKWATPSWKWSRHTAQRYRESRVGSRASKPKCQLRPTATRQWETRSLFKSVITFIRTSSSKLFWFSTTKPLSLKRGHFYLDDEWHIF